MASYEKSKNGTWSVRFYATENFKNKQKRLRGFATKKEAEKAYIDFQNKTIEEKNNKIDKDGTKLLFLELFNEFCNYKKNRLKESSYYDLIQKSKLHILPYFKDMLVIQISPKSILTWQQSLEHYSFKYKTSLRTYLFEMLKYAERYYKIPNQILYVDNFKNTEIKKEMQIWSENDFTSFIEACSELKYKAFFSALFLTGCRKNELLATTWKDWDLKNNTLAINKNIIRKVIGKKFIVSSPKNYSSYRTIKITNNLSNLIKEYYSTIESHSDNDFVFGGKEPFALTTIDNYYLKKCKEAGVKQIRLHDFRHSHASYLIGHGASIVAVAKRLGHKNIEQTLNTYSHLIKEEENSMLKQLDEISF